MGCKVQSKGSLQHNSMLDWNKFLILVYVAEPLVLFNLFKDKYTVKNLVHSDSCRESDFGSFCLNWSCGCQSNSLHLLGCKKRSRFQFPWTFPVRSCRHTYAFWNNSGMWMFIMFLILSTQ